MVPCRVRTLWVVSVWGGGDACVVLLPSGRTAHRGAGARMQWASPARVVQGPCKHDKRELFYLENWIVVGPGSGGSSAARPAGAGAERRTRHPRAGTEPRTRVRRGPVGLGSMLGSRVRIARNRTDAPDPWCVRNLRVSRGHREHLARL